MERQWSLEESVVVDAAPEVVYRLVADLRAMGRWSPECRRVWVRRPPVGAGSRFVGLNRRGPFVWFTTGRISAARVGEEFTFDVGVFGLPIARWGYRFAAEGTGTRVTETWQDLRTGRASRLTELLGTVFAGTNPERRIAVNRHGMRTTLDRIARAATVAAP
ncbi:SRPBCC family protein [Streptomyces sp. Je 1-79]|uniref:SRPBCC family protein n=1 Tax=Streptomyces sp. Je 1-79 TaxID=2943847 RepID=UPI0021A77691|nr:SRPBCC family protein [Streptomyces sp. Je 1-79]MCT4357530.1 SRPBCC family protein [Streptomyces sp. Je 1-79]